MALWIASLIAFALVLIASRSYREGIWAVVLRYSFWTLFVLLTRATPDAEYELVWLKTLSLILFASTLCFPFRDIPESWRHMRRDG